MAKQAYEKLFAIANAALNSIEGPGSHQLHLLPEQLAIVALDYAVSALEAYVNYLGYIFIDAWPVLQRKHFWGQYEQITEVLAKLNVILPKEPIDNYRTVRDKRNHLHHAQAMHSNEQNAKITVADAKQVVTSVAHFMRETQQQIQTQLRKFDSFEAIWLCVSADNQLNVRKALYQTLIG